MSSALCSLNEISEGRFASGLVPDGPAPLHSSMHKWRDYDEIKVDFVCNEENTLQIWRKSNLEKQILPRLWPAWILQTQAPAAL